MIGRFLRLTLRGLADFRLHPVAQLLTMVAVAMVTLLTGLILTGFHTVNLELLKSRGQVEFQAYWKQDQSRDAVRADWDAIGAMPHLTDFATFTPEDALTELASTLGESGDFSWLAGDNPLPHSALVRFAVPPEAQEEGWAARLLTALKELPGVDTVNYTPFQTDLAQGWMTLSQVVIWPVLGFLGLVISLVVHNTIKLSLLTRMDEIEILSLVGASPSYIRWPLLTSGFLQGFVGASAGLGLLAGVHSLAADALDFAPFFIRIPFLPLEQMLMLAGGVTLVAMASSWVAVK
ncbi:cell division protein FtsX [Pseudodesulfovibrio pelocollis]|uniref:cell division protein FtsX n=1 Tax=Pseudodesulfovibrio pelocollis TaxID=3051432 RepID=UPI00255AB61F|nr:permease-like cell division protein FtsX [Pseudodesulfovibrio sp. SB368]